MSKDRFWGHTAFGGSGLSQPLSESHSGQGFDMYEIGNKSEDPLM